MDKKLTDLVESIEDRLLEQIEEQEISQELKERIKVKALDIEIKKLIPFKKKLNKRILLVAAIMTLLSIAIGAASSNKTLQQFFSQNLSIILPSTQDIAKDISKNGITMTIDTAFGGNSGGIIVIHFTRDNGLAFKEDTQLKDLKVNVKDAMGFRGYSSSWEISKDRKTLTYMIDFKSSQEIVGKEIEIIASNLVNLTHHQEMLDLDLQAIYEDYREEELYVGEDIDSIEETEFVEDKVVGLKDKLEGIDLKHPYSDVVLSGIGFENGMYLVMDYTNVDRSLYNMFALVDTRTNKPLVEDSMSMRSSSMHEIQTEVWSYKNITEEDLKHLKLIKMYNNYQYQVRGEWKLSFTLEKNDHVKVLKKEKEVPIEQGIYTVNEIELSVLGIHIDGEVKHPKNKETPMLDNEVYEDLVDFEANLVMKNGDKLKLDQTLSSGGDSRFVTYMTLVNNDGWDTLTEEEKQIKHEGFRLEGGVELSGLDYILEEKQYIDIDQVKALEIEGVEIPLK